MSSSSYLSSSSSSRYDARPSQHISFQGSTGEDVRRAVHEISVEQFTSALAKGLFSDRHKAQALSIGVLVIGLLSSAYAARYYKRSWVVSFLCGVVGGLVSKELYARTHVWACKKLSVRVESSSAQPAGTRSTSIFPADSGYKSHGTELPSRASDDLRGEHFPARSTGTGSTSEYPRPHWMNQASGTPDDLRGEHSPVRSTGTGSTSEYPRPRWMSQASEAPDGFRDSSGSGSDEVSGSDSE